MIHFPVPLPKTFMWFFKRCFVTFLTCVREGKEGRAHGPQHTCRDQKTTFHLMGFGD